MHEHLKVLVTNIGDLTSYSFRRVAATVSALAERSEPETIALGGWIDRAMGMATSAARYNAQKSRQSVISSKLPCCLSFAPRWMRPIKIEVGKLRRQSCQWKALKNSVAGNAFADMLKSGRIHRAGACRTKAQGCSQKEKWPVLLRVWRSNACRRLCKPAAVTYVHPWQFFRFYRIYFRLKKKCWSWSDSLTVKKSLQLDVDVMQGAMLPC